MGQDCAHRVQFPKIQLDAEQLDEALMEVETSKAQSTRLDDLKGEYATSMACDGIEKYVAHDEDDDPRTRLIHTRHTGRRGRRGRIRNANNGHGDSNRGSQAYDWFRQSDDQL